MVLIKSENKILGAILQIILVSLVIFLIVYFYKLSINGGENGWKNLLVKNTDVFVTDSWFAYNKSKNTGSFSIAVPDNWQLKGSVFHDKNNKKVAELSPGLVYLNPNQKCFDRGWSNEYGVSEFISLEDIKIGSLVGKLLIERSEAWDGTINNKYWYPYFYCLSNSNTAFTITFYEWNLDMANKKFHMNVLKTLNLGGPARP
jgi:hypothetical protein